MRSKISPNENQFGNGLAYDTHRFPKMEITKNGRGTKDEDDD